MSLYLLTTTDDGETGSVSVNLPEYHDEGSRLPYVFHMFGRESVEKWQSGTDGQRLATIVAVINRVLMAVTFAQLEGLSEEDVFKAGAERYNKACAAEGIEDHAVEYVSL